MQPFCILHQRDIDVSQIFLVVTHLVALLNQNVNIVLSQNGHSINNWFACLILVTFLLSVGQHCQNKIFFNKMFYVSMKIVVYYFDMNIFVGRSKNYLI